MCDRSAPAGKEQCGSDNTSRRGQSAPAASLSSLSSIVDTLASIHPPDGLTSTDWTKTLGLDTYGAGLSTLPSIVDTLTSTHLDGLNTYGAGLSTLSSIVDTLASIHPDGLTSTDWTKTLGLDTYGAGLSTLSSIVETHAVEAEASLSEEVAASENLLDRDWCYLQWPCDATDLVAILVTLSFLPPGVALPPARA